MAEAEDVQHCSDQVDGRQTKHLCNPCKNEGLETVAALYCKSCKEFQCDECCKYHGRFALLKGHEIVDLKNAEAPRFTFDLKGLELCKNHKKKLEFYCVDDDLLCCSSCAIARHRGCREVNELTAEAEKRKTFLSNVNTTLSDLENRSSNNTKVLTETKDSLGNELKLVLHEIDATQILVNEKFENLRKTVTEQINENVHQAAEELDEHLTKINNLTDKVKEFQVMAAEGLKLGCSEQQFIIAHVINKEIAQYSTILSRQISDIKTQTFSVQYSHSLTEVLQSKESLATLKEEIKSVEPTDTRLSVELKLETSKKLVRENGDNYDPLYTGMDFFADGRLVGVDNKNFTLRVMAESLETLGSFKLSGVRRDVVVLSDEEIVVTGGGAYRLEFFHVNEMNTMTLTKTIRTEIKYYSISLMNETTFVVSTADDRRPMRMVTITGEEKDFDNLPEKSFTRGNSAGTYICNKDLLVLVDRHENVLNIYDYNNNCSVTCYVNDQSIKQPIGICVAPDDSLFLCSRGTDSIVHVSWTGKVLGSYKLDFRFPKTICISKDGKKLAVSNEEHGNKVLNIYTVQRN